MQAAETLESDPAPRDDDRASEARRFALHDENRWRTEQIVTTAGICRRVLAAGRLDEALDAAVRDLVESCGYNDARVLVPGAGGRPLGVAARRSASAPIAADGGNGEAGAGPADRAAAEGRTVCLNDLESEPGPAATADGARAELCVPLMAGQELLGVLDVRAREPHAFSRDRIGLIESLGAVLTLAIDRARSEEGARNARERMEAQAEAASREKQALKIQLLHSERLSTLGQLISGVAHELNNPLTGVIGYSQLLAESDCEERIRKGIEKVYSEARRCHRVVQGLLDVARRHSPERQYVSINDIVQSTLDLRAYQLRVDDISVVKDLSRDLPRTLADYHQLQQVFLNIVNNAHHAMRETGKRGTLTVRSSTANGRIRVEFTDTGAGVPAADLERIFEPFFTTKEPGQGTGLGLAICSGIVEDHQGRILAASSPLGGAVITVDLPVLHREAPAQDPG